MVKATPKDFQFSVKVPETVTHIKRLNVTKGAIDSLNEFLDKISPLRQANKLGAVLIQLPPSFLVAEFKQAEEFLDSLPKDYEYALEFRQASWQTEGPYELSQQYTIALVLTDSPDPKLQFLSNVAVTADHAFIRLHGRNKGYWYNYLYSEEQLAPRVAKVSEIKKQTKTLRIYFNNHYGGKAVLNALQFKEIIREKLSKEQIEAKQKAEAYLKGKMACNNGFERKDNRQTFNCHDIVNSHLFGSSTVSC